MCVKTCVMFRSLVASVAFFTIYFPGNQGIIFEAFWRIKCEPPDALCPQIWRSFSTQWLSNIFPVPVQHIEPVCQDVFMFQDCWQFICTMTVEDPSSVGNASDCALAKIKMAYEPNRDQYVETKGVFHLQVSNADSAKLRSFTETQINSNLFEAGQIYPQELPLSLTNSWAFQQIQSRRWMHGLVHRDLTNATEKVNVTIEKRLQYAVEYHVKEFRLVKLDKNVTCGSRVTQRPSATNAWLLVGSVLIFLIVA